MCNTQLQYQGRYLRDMEMSPTGGIGITFSLVLAVEIRGIIFKMYGIADDLFHKQMRIF